MSNNKSEEEEEVSIDEDDQPQEQQEYNGGGIEIDDDIGEAEEEEDEDDDDDDVFIHQPYSTNPNEEDDDQDNPYSTMSFTANTNLNMNNRMNLLYSDNQVVLQQQQQQQQQQHNQQQLNNQQLNRVNLLYSDNQVAINNSNNSISTNNNERPVNLLYSENNVPTYSQEQDDDQNSNSNSINDRYNLLYSDNQVVINHQQQQQNNHDNHDNDIEMGDQDDDHDTNSNQTTSTTTSTTTTNGSDHLKKSSSSATGSKKGPRKSKYSLKKPTTLPPTTDNNPLSPTSTSNPLSSPEGGVDVSTIKPPQIDFSYDVNSLTWDIDHIENKEKKYCYCGNDQDSSMIRCDHCLQRFHIGCVKLLEGSGQMQGDWVYRFACAVCTNGNESFERFSKNWVDILEIVLHHLEQTNPNQKYFSFDNEIIPIIDQNWYLLCSDKKKKANWQKPLLTALSNGRIFKSGAVNIQKPGYWALGMKQLLLKDNPIFKDKVLAPLHRKKKKKKTTQEEIRFKHLTKLLLVPLKEGVYVPTVEYDVMCVAAQNSAPQITIDSDLMTVKNMSGYRMAKASFPCICGEWYFEIEILNGDGACRLGWSTQRGDRQANVGYDQFSYAYRSQQGDVFHQAKSKPYGETYTKGDIIGFYIKLPIANQSNQLHHQNGNGNEMMIDNNNNEESKIIFTENTDQLEIYERASDELESEELSVLEASEIRFYKNGVSPGPAFTNIGRGMYYPAASMYMGASVRFNFGPDFKYPPSSYRPMSSIIKK